MKKHIAIIVMLVMLLLMSSAMADDITSEIDYSALETYEKSWNARMEELGLGLSFHTSKENGNISFSGSFLSSEPRQVHILDSLSDPGIPADLLMLYTSDNNIVALIYGRPDITEIPKNVHIYADGVNCGGAVEYYPAATEEDTDLYSLEFDLECIHAILNTQDAFIRLVTENDTYFQEMNTDTWLAPYLMWSVISEGINYSRKTSDTYLDSSLLAYETVSTQQVEDSDVQTRSFQTDYEAIDRAAQSVFLLEVYNESNETIATGSGFVAFDTGTLITNEHVIEDAAYIIAYSDQYKASYKLLNLKAVDEKKDIAILEFDADANVTPLTIDLQSKLLRGQPVTAIGSPRGVINTVSSGNISNIVYYSEEIPDYIQFTAPISPGSSGGALFNDNGAVIGLCVSFLKEADAMYYAIPMKYVEEMYLAAQKNTPMTLAQYNNMATSLSAPRLLAPRIGDDCIELLWSNVSYAEEYEVYRREESSADFSLVTTTQKACFLDSDVVVGVKYEYYVKAYCGWCSSKPSNTVGITMIKATPTPSPKPTATPKPTPIPKGKVIYELYDVNKEIIIIKLRLYELGYYSSNNDFNDTYTLLIQSAVKSFQQKNNLSATGEVDDVTQKLLSVPKNSSNAKKGPLTVPSAVQEYSRKTYQLNDKGGVVKSLKKRLQTLGYYRSSSGFDDEYNQTMVERVKQFQKNNALEETGIIDYVTLIKLYSTRPEMGEWYVKPTATPVPTPIPVPEKAVTLEIPDGSYGEWQYVSGDGLKFHLQVKNTSKTRTIVAYELYVYPEDVWGERLIPEDKIYVISVEEKLGPGRQHYSDYVTMGDAKKIDKVYVAVNKVKYSDGTIKTVDYHDYSCWEIN